MEKQQFCTQCDNHCPVDALKCGRGRRFFGVDGGEEGREHGHGHEMPDGPIGLLRQCGHMLHHGVGAKEDLLRALSEEERRQLEELLGRLLADWKQRAPEDGHKQHHEHHHG